MKKYLTKFQDLAAYNAAKSSLDLPNVSIIASTDGSSSVGMAYEPKPILPTNTILTLTDDSTVEIVGTELTKAMISDVYKTTLKSCVVGSSVTSIGGSAFISCTGLISIVISNSVTSIGNFAFQNCNSLSSIVISNSVTSIGQYAFSGCRSISSMVIPDGVSSVRNGTFKDCTSLTSIEIPNSITSIGYQAFFGCRLSSIVIPNSITSIGTDAFEGCSSLNSITIPNSVISVGYNALAYCIYLVIEKLYSGYTNIGGRFLTDVTICDVDSGLNFSSYDVLANIYQLTSSSTKTITLRTENQSLITAISNSMSNYKPALTINIYDLSGNLTTTLHGTNNTTITFYVDGVPYEAANGMTWGEFVNSAYNTNGWVASERNGWLDIENNTHTQFISTTPSDYPGGGGGGSND